ncbi:MAG: OsmC family protein [Candidatus Eremiobacteraeota bacterium]|nr:OsmC family protein [Candidatus Eremiobacteraeota bacterium]
MNQRHSTAKWTGSLKEGGGQMKIGENGWEGKFSFPSRFESADGTNPEELIGAAHAGCFSMALTASLGKAGFNPESVATKATVHFGLVDGVPTIAKIELQTEADVPDIDDAKFQEIATGAKEGCPVSRALAGTEIHLDAKLKVKA